MLQLISKKDTSALYKINGQIGGKVDRYILTTPETRAICNNPRVLGMEYTRKLQKGCEFALKSLVNDAALILNETETIVFNILRGGLNFGLRDSLADAFNWNAHSSSFISAQRRRCENNPDEWEIVEGDYHKLYLKPISSIVFGDVVATGTSLEHGLEILIDEVIRSESQIRNMTFFTIGGIRTEEILEKAGQRLSQICPDFEGISLIYIDGCFVVPTAETPLQIKITGTDLIKRDALMAPEFIESQYESPYYPLERCTIYDAGSRAFLVPEYAEDLCDYWKEVLELAKNGMNFKMLVEERTPFLESDRFADENLVLMAQSQVDFFEKYI